MPDTLEIRGSVTLPLLGLKTLTLDEPLGGLEDQAIAEILSLDGGTVDAKASVGQSGDGVTISAQVTLPFVGEKTLSLDEKLNGIEQTVVDELLKLDGGSMAVELSVTRQGA